MLLLDLIDCYMLLSIQLYSIYEVPYCAPLLLFMSLYNLLALSGVCGAGIVGGGGDGGPLLEDKGLHHTALPATRRHWQANVARDGTTVSFPFFDSSTPSAASLSVALHAYITL